MQIKNVPSNSTLINKAPGAAAPTTTSSSAVKVSLFKSSSFSQAPAAVTFGDGSSIRIPGLSDDDIKQGQKLLSGLDDQQTQGVLAAGSQLAAAFYDAAGTPSGDSTAVAGKVGGMTMAAATDEGSYAASAAALNSSAAPAGFQQSDAGTATSTAAVTASNSTSNVVGSTTATPGQLTGGTVGPTALVASPQLTQAVGKAVSTYQAANPGANYDQTVQAVTFSGVLGLQNQLSDYAKYVQNNINQSNAIQGQAEDINTTLAAWPTGSDGKPAATVTFNVTTQQPDGTYSTAAQALTQGQAKTAYSNLQSTLSTMSSQTQTDQLQLQNMSQNYSQGINTISTLLKMNYDTVKGIIGNIRSG